MVHCNPEFVEFVVNRDLDFLMSVKLAISLIYVEITSNLRPSREARTVAVKSDCEPAE